MFDKKVNEILIDNNDKLKNQDDMLKDGLGNLRDANVNLGETHGMLID